MYVLRTYVCVYVCMYSVGVDVEDWGRKGRQTLSSLAQICRFSRPTAPGPYRRNKGVEFKWGQGYVLSDKVPK
jgi:hypothetical protein